MSASNYISVDSQWQDGEMDLVGRDCCDPRLQKTRRIFLLLGFAAIALQRIGFTFSGGATLSMTLFVLLAAVAVSILYVRSEIKPINLIVFAALVVVAAASTVLAFNDGASEASIPSFVLFVATYSLVIVRGGARTNNDLGIWLFSGAVTAIKIGACAGIIQFFAQKAGFGFLDPFKYAPSQILVTGYNTYYDLRYQGAPGQFKPNGVIFLEPSSLSLYSSIALVFVLGQLFGRIDGGTRRRNVVWVLVLLGGIAASASSSGILILAAAVIPLILGIRKNRPLILVIVIAGVTAALAGVFNSVIEKANEGFTGQTSNALRLTLPYQLLFPDWLSRPFLGWGPGMASTLVSQTGIAGLQATTLMKLLVEYGLSGATVIAIVVTISLRRSTAPLYISTAVFCAWFLPAEALVNSTLVILLLFALPNWRSTREPKTTPVQPSGLVVSAVPTVQLDTLRGAESRTIESVSSLRRGTEKSVEIR